MVSTQASFPEQKSMHTVSPLEAPTVCISRSKRCMYFTGMTETCSSTLAAAVTPSEKARFVASNTDRSNYILGALNGKSAKQVYKDILHVTDEEILTRTLSGSHPSGGRCSPYRS